MEDPPFGPVPEAGSGQRPRLHAGENRAEGRPENAASAPHKGVEKGAAPNPPQKPAHKKRRRRRRKAFVRDSASRSTPLAAELAPARQALPAAVTQPLIPLHFHAPGRLRPVPVQPAGGATGGSGAQARHATPERRGLSVFAALDLGTNNCRLLVAVPSAQGQFRVIDAFSRIVRLGEGVSVSGRLGAAAMDRAVDALKVCGDKLRARDLRRARLIATEACRAAENGPEFLRRVEREAGLRLEIIDRHTEAKLAVSGCGSLVDGQAQGAVLFDIGGGSTEIALIDLSRGRPPRLADAIAAWTSLPVGVVSLAEKFGGRTVTPEVFASMTQSVAELLERFVERGSLAHMVDSPRFHLLGTSGTVTTLAGIHLKLDRYDRRRVDGLWMDGADLDRIVETLAGWDFAARVASPCIGPDRADLVLAGCAILQAIRAVWPAKRLRVADRGLREGILSELMAEEGAWGRFARDNRTEARP